MSLAALMGEVAWIGFPDLLYINTAGDIKIRINLLL